MTINFSAIATKTLLISLATLAIGLAGPAAAKDQSHDASSAYASRDDYGGSRNDYGGSRNDYGGSRNDYGGSRNDYGGSRNDYGGSRNDY